MREAFPPVRSQRALKIVDEISPGITPTVNVLQHGKTHLTSSAELEVLLTGLRHRDLPVRRHALDQRIIQKQVVLLLCV